jgi:hypothetical protein
MLDRTLCQLVVSTRVQNPTQNDWFKLHRMMDFLKTTVNDGLTLQANLNIIVNWYLNTAFTVHSDFKSHTGSCMTLGQGAIMAISMKQKINTHSSTKAELVSTDDIIAKVIWMK